MTQFYSRNDTTFQGDSIFTIPFSYIKQEDINIFVNDELIKDWLWLNETQVSITKELTLGDLISIRRQTPIDEKIVDYQNMSMVLDDNNLNLSQDQNIYSIQELYDNNEQFIIDAENTIISNLEEYKGLQETFENEINTQFSEYRTEINDKVQIVADAAENINELRDSIITATNAAQIATEKAEEAITTSQEGQSLMQEMLEEARNTVDSRANIDLSNLSEVGQAKFDSKVSKLGDTITGNLQIEGALTVEGWNNTLYNMLVLKTDQDFTTAPEATCYPNIEIQDKNGLRMGRIEYQHQNDGGHRISLVDKKDANTATYASIFVGFDKDGNPICNFPKCTTKATKTSTAHSSNVAVIVQNYKNGASWYRVWSDGWIECGGIATVKSKTSSTVTYPKAFSDTNYTLVTAIGSSTGGDYSFNITADIGHSTYSTTKFSVRNDGLGQNIKVRFYACGY